MKAFAIGTALAAFAAAGCATAPENYAPGQSSAQADIMEPGGRLIARAIATDVGDSVRVQVEAAGLAPGTYGAHVHAVGRCDPPGFESAGPHWNPTDRDHGRDNPDGQHLGDLPNLMVGEGGSGRFEVTIPQASVAGGALRMLDEDGAALVIHAGADDYRTDPSGNSGSRIGCGVFR